MSYTEKKESVSNHNPCLHLTPHAKENLEYLAYPFSEDTGEDLKVPSKACFKKAEKFLASLPDKLQNAADFVLSCYGDAIEIQWRGDNGEVTFYVYEREGIPRIDYEVSLEGTLDNSTDAVEPLLSLVGEIYS